MRGRAASPDTPAERRGLVHAVARNALVVWGALVVALSAFVLARPLAIQVASLAGGPACPVALVSGDRAELGLKVGLPVERVQSRQSALYSGLQALPEGRRAARAPWPSLVRSGGLLAILQRAHRTSRGSGGSAALAMVTAASKAGSPSKCPEAVSFRLSRT